jgi:hypothetical protein
MYQRQEMKQGVVRADSCSPRLQHTWPPLSCTSNLRGSAKLSQDIPVTKREGKGDDVGYCREGARSSTCSRTNALDECGVCSTVDERPTTSFDCSTEGHLHIRFCGTVYSKVALGLELLPAWGRVVCYLLNFHRTCPSNSEQEQICTPIMHRPQRKM